LLTDGQNIDRAGVMEILKSIGLETLYVDKERIIDNRIFDCMILYIWKFIIDLEGRIHKVEKMRDELMD
jgi:hypothetical protein